MRVGDLAIATKLYPPRIVNVTYIKGRLLLCAWFIGDPKDQNLAQGQFWAHQLDFNADRVREMAKAQGFGK